MTTEHHYHTPTLWYCQLARRRGVELTYRVTVCMIFWVRVETAIGNPRKEHAMGKTEPSTSARTEAFLLREANKRRRKLLEGEAQRLRDQSPQYCYGVVSNNDLFALVRYSPGENDLIVLDTLHQAK